MHEVIGTGYSYYGVRTTTNSYDWMLKLEGETEYGTGYYNGDYALIGNCVQSFVYRSGYWDDGMFTGVFVFAIDGGGTGYKSGFRPVLVV